MIRDWNMMLATCSTIDEMVAWVPTVVHFWILPDALDVSGVIS